MTNIPGRYSSGGPFEEKFGYSRLVVAGPNAYVSGSTALIVAGKQTVVWDVLGSLRARSHWAHSPARTDHVALWLTQSTCRLRRSSILGAR